MNVREEGQAFFDATLELDRREWCTLPRVLAGYPLMHNRDTLGSAEAVVEGRAGIYPPHERPPGAAQEVTDAAPATSISAEENVRS